MFSYYQVVDIKMHKGTDTKWTPCPVRFSTAVINTMTYKNWERKGFIWLTGSSS